MNTHFESHLDSQNLSFARISFFSPQEAHYFIYSPTVLYVHLWAVQKHFFFLSNPGNFKCSKQLLKIKLSNSSPRTALGHLRASRELSIQLAAVYASSVHHLQGWRYSFPPNSAPWHGYQDLHLKRHSRVDLTAHHDMVGIRAVTQWSLSLSHAQNSLIRNSLTHNELKSPHPHLLAWKSRLGPLGASWDLNDNVAEAKAGRCPPRVQVLGASCPARLRQQPPETQGGLRVLPGAQALRGLAAGRPEPSEPLAKEHPHREPRPENCPDIFMLLESKRKCQRSASFLEVPLIRGVFFSIGYFTVLNSFTFSVPQRTGKSWKKCKTISLIWKPGGHMCFRGQICLKIQTLWFYTSHETHSENQNVPSSNTYH